MLGIYNATWWFEHRPRLRYWQAFLLALVWTLVWGCARWPRLRIYFRCATYAGWVAWRNAFAWGRRECPEPVVCEECGWAGPRRWVFHAYQDDGSGEDVEPVDECPNCGREI
jgi:hypothetical protein